jgi:hypothetical protein
MVVDRAILAYFWPRIPNPVDISQGNRRCRPPHQKSDSIGRASADGKAMGSASSQQPNMAPALASCRLVKGEEVFVVTKKFAPRPPDLRMNVITGITIRQEQSGSTNDLQGRVLALKA